MKNLYSEIKNVGCSSKEFGDGCVAVARVIKKIKPLPMRDIALIRMQLMRYKHGLLAYFFIQYWQWFFIWIRAK